MSSRTVWTRLEPWARDEDLRAGIEARVHDPLWFLARQWQLGEFAGEDAASPVRVSAELAVTPCSSYAPTAAQPGGRALSGVPYDPRGAPIEAVAEGESLASPAQPGWLLGARAGLDFLDAVSAVARDGRKGVTGALLKSFPIPPPAAGDITRWGEDRLRPWTLLAQRAPDGAALYALLRRDEGLERLLASLGEAAPPRDTMRTLVGEWMATYQALLEPEPPARAPSSWVPERLQYGFSVGVGAGAEQVVLAAADHDGGRLDWTSFDVVDGATIESAGGSPGSRTSTTINALPSAVQFAGMPNQRYWELEDGAVNFGAIDASTLDLPRLLFLQFGLTYGNDFFLVPATVPVGSLCATTRFSVYDTFGERHEIPATNAAAGGWRMFALAGGEAANGMLWLPASLPGSCQGAALELVRLARDEGANLTWAIEAVVEGPTGQPVARRDLERRPPSAEGPPAPAGPAETLFYNLVAAPPPSWIPLQNVPARKVTDPVNVLAPLTTDNIWGRVLGALRVAPLQEESVPREGVEVARRFEHARWIDGRSVLWLGRSRSVGRGELSSALRFDFTER